MSQVNKKYVHSQLKVLLSRNFKVKSCILIRLLDRCLTKIDGRQILEKFKTGESTLEIGRHNDKIWIGRQEKILCP